MRRELLEELGAEADVGRLVATIENLFTYEGEHAHEICLVYECSLRDKRLYGLEEWEAEEETSRGVVAHPISWRAIDSFRPSRDIFHPEQLLDFLSA